MALTYLILVVVLALSPNQNANVSNACRPGASGLELFKYGGQWLRWTDYERDIYLEGFVDGGSTYARTFSSEQSPVLKSLVTRNLVQYDNDVLSPVVTSLYRDPANVYIRFDAMIFIARDKLLGKDIEAMLRYSRQNDCGGSLKK
jgi:hypothetical protein